MRADVPSALDTAVQLAERDDDMGGGVLVVGSITLVADARILLGADKPSRRRDALMTDSQPTSRSADLRIVVFTQTTLLLESLATFFAMLVTWGLGRADVVDVSTGSVWVAGSALAAAFAFASGRANTRWGRVLGWILHLPLIAGGLWVPAIAFVGIMFLGDLRARRPAWVRGLTASAPSLRAREAAEGEAQ